MEHSKFRGDARYATLLDVMSSMELFYKKNQNLIVFVARYINKNVKAKEYLIANSFNNVFEAMIDSLISDQNDEVKKLKKNDDGKIIDHLYKEKSLIFADGTESIWHIGDSKYYQEKNDLSPESIAKQYTYAKNIIQNFFSSQFVNGSEECYSSGVHKGVRYRDSVTEGYSVTPNFFIRGFVPDYNSDEQYTDPYFSKKDESGGPIKPGDDMWKERNRHFRNRLFDRDTLLLKVYDINFLFVLKTYISKHSSLRDDFKKKTRKRFRDDFLELLGDNYYFWAVYLPDWQKSDYAERLQDFVDRHFHALVGRVFQPAGTPHCLILALEQSAVNVSLKGALDKDYEKIRQIVKDEKCEIFQVWPHEIWDNGNSQKWDDESLQKNKVTELGVVDALVKFS